MSNKTCRQEKKGGNQPECPAKVCKHVFPFQSFKVVSVEPTLSWKEKSSCWFSVWHTKPNHWIHVFEYEMEND